MKLGNMKRYLSTILAATLIAGLAACGGGVQQTASSTEKSTPSPTKTANPVPDVAGKPWDAAFTALVTNGFNAVVIGKDGKKWATGIPNHTVTVVSLKPSAGQLSDSGDVEVTVNMTEAEFSAATKAAADADKAKAEALTHVTGIGDVATNGGIQIKVTSAVASPTVSLNTSGYRAGSGLDRYEDVPALAGGKYIIVDALVTNNAKAPIDLTCSYPIDFKVFNSSSQVYSPIEKLYEIKGNPECNAELQPGFESPMTWAFLVSASSTIDGAVFSEVDFASRGLPSPTYIAFGAGLK